MAMEMKTFAGEVVTKEGAEVAGITIGENEFVGKMSTTELDRDGEIIDKGAFDPLPDEITVDIDHRMSVERTVAAGRPFYHGDDLMIHARWAIGEHVPLARHTKALVDQNIVKKMSVAFMNAKREDDDSEVPHITSAELLNVAIVPVPSNRGAEIMASKGLAGLDRATVKEVLAEVFSDLADPELRSMLEQAFNLNSSRKTSEEDPPGSAPVPATDKAAGEQALARQRLRKQALAHRAALLTR